MAKLDSFISTARLFLSKGGVDSFRTLGYSDGPQSSDYAQSSSGR